MHGDKQKQRQNSHGDVQRVWDTANVEHGELQPGEDISGAVTRRVAGGLLGSAVHINGKDNRYNVTVT